MRVLNRDNLRQKGVPYGPTQIWRLEKQGLFPRHIRLGGNRIGWVEPEVDEWIAGKVAERDAEMETAR